MMQDKAALANVVDRIFPVEAAVRAPRGCVLTRQLSDAEKERRVGQVAPPLLVKPNFSGSSEGLEIFDTHHEAIAAATSMLDREGRVLVQHLEQAVAEISCTVIDYLDGPMFLPIVELRRDDALVMGKEQKFGKEGRDRHVIPARIDAETSARIKKVVLRLHEEVGCVGLTRTDLLLLGNGELCVLEMNGIPGLLESSIACDAALAAGISFDELCESYANSAFIVRDEPDIWEVRYASN
ncbi:hypothetical protein [Aquibium sp. ELW1220]|uniref:hypothetical protein n=1 Tax=Aquibium sp. ELW1220 TaxID=2976766 RepID=UPI0025B00A03|nr:hypothetical protein [Aquibium sp. ELW1220]MDN2578747.1 hypothetical protein [Aquibium sp. ELW1220]